MTRFLVRRAIELLLAVAAMANMLVWLLRHPGDWIPIVVGLAAGMLCQHVWEMDK